MRGVPSRFLPLVLASATLAPLLAGCDPYERRDGEFFAGSVDPAGFPAAYLGRGGRGNMAGSGVFVPVLARVKGQDVAYYDFPLPAAQAEAEDPLDTATLGAALAYVFDPEAASPFPAKARCQAPAGYVYDPQKDAYRLDEQGQIFTLLPDDPAYVPVVAQVPVTTAGAPCQDIKSEATLLTRSDVRVPITPPPADLPEAPPQGKPDGKLLAWAIIDPAARVLGPMDDPDDPSLPGLFVQRWGWYKHHLLAYLDGGYLPVVTEMNQKRLQAQALYYPVEVLEKDMNGKDVIVPQDGPGQGYDVLTAARGQAGYSALCHVFTYDMRDNKDRPILVDSAGAIDEKTVTDTGEYRYCLQVR